MKLHHNHSKLLEKNAGIGKKILYGVTMAAGIAGPFTTVPQIYKVFTEPNVSGVSLMSWFLFTLLSAPFVLWGVVQRDMPVAVTYFLWTVMNSLVVAGLLLR